MAKKIEVSMSVGRQDVGSGYTARDFDAMAIACVHAAAAIRSRHHGEINVTDVELGDTMWIGIHNTEYEFDMEKGLPPLREVHVMKGKKK
jgi:hypothetical protein